MTLNERAELLCRELVADAGEYRVACDTIGDARIIDCGCSTVGGIAAGLAMSRICLAGLATVTLVPSVIPEIPGPAIQVQTDQPVRACLASQYAGWQIAVGKYFGMGSGPMRAASAREEIFQHIPGKEEPPCAVGVIESRKLPTDDVVAHLRSKLPASVQRMTLLAAPASSLAGNLQVVARSVETALHKLHELKFDVNQVAGGYGVAPLPPVAPNEIAAIGRTNDAILYGGRVTLWVTADDATIDEIGPKVPSNSSKDHGRLFAELFAEYGDFYKIDPLLFSPAEVTFVNLATGRSRTFGALAPELLRKSFNS